MRRNIKVSQVIRFKAFVFEYEQYSFEVSMLILTVSLAFLIGG